jgi:hypothetical protein
MHKKERLAALRSMLISMESEVGLDVLSEGQRDLYYAACLSADEQYLVQSDDLRAHPMLQRMPRSTFFRLLRELISFGYLAPAGSPRSGKYLIKR